MATAISMDTLRKCRILSGVFGVIPILALSIGEFTSWYGFIGVEYSYALIIGLEFYVLIFVTFVGIHADSEGVFRLQCPVMGGCCLPRIKSVCMLVPLLMFFVLIVSEFIVSVQNMKLSLTFSFILLFMIMPRLISIMIKVRVGTVYYRTWIYRLLSAMTVFVFALDYGRNIHAGFTMIGTIELVAIYAYFIGIFLWEWHLKRDA